MIEGNELSRLEALRAAEHQLEPDGKAKLELVAAVAHFEIAEVHPFADYNGRTARLFATAVFYRERFLDGPLFSPERYYAEDKDAYYVALRAIKRTHHLDEWLTYFVTGLAVELERIGARARELSALTRALPLPIQLTPGQERARRRPSR